MAARTYTKNETTLVKSQPWMHGDIQRPLKVAKMSAKRKLTAAERPAYMACVEAMASGSIYSWSIDDRKGAWLVKVTEGEDWRELSASEVVELVGGVQVSSTPARKARAVKAQPDPVAEVVDIATVRPTPVSDAVGDYLARLIFEPKRDYAAAYAAHLNGAPMPVDPGTEWAVKVRIKLARLVGTSRHAVAS